MVEPLGDVDAYRDDRQTQTQADADRVHERVAEFVECVADVAENRDREILRQIADQLDGAGNEMFAAHLFIDDVSVLVVDRVAVRVDGLLHGRQLVDAVAAHAAVATGEEALRRARMLGRSRHRRRADVGAQQHVPLRRDVEHALALQAHLQEVGVRAE